MLSRLLSPLFRFFEERVNPYPESGTHQELLARNGIYAGLWQRQSGGFLGNDLDLDNNAPI